MRVVDSMFIVFLLPTLGSDGFLDRARFEENLSMSLFDFLYLSPKSSVPDPISLAFDYEGSILQIRKGAEIVNRTVFIFLVAVL